MRPLGVRSIVFPALGTGAASFPVEDAAAAMAEVVSDVLRQNSWPIDVSIMLMSRTLASPMQYVAFYEEFARRVPVVAAHESKQGGPVRNAQPSPAVSDLLSLEQQRQALEQELADLPAEEADAGRRAELRAALERNTDQRLRMAQREQSSRQKAASVFVSYAREDEELLRKLRDHLGGMRAGGYIKDWSDGQIVPGQEWAAHHLRLPRLGVHQKDRTGKSTGAAPPWRRHRDPGNPQTSRLAKHGPSRTPGTAQGRQGRHRLA